MAFLRLLFSSLGEVDPRREKKAKHFKQRRRR